MKTEHNIMMARLAELLLPPLCQGMLDPDVNVRWMCVAMLRMFGAEASPAIPAIRDLMNSPDEEEEVRLAGEALIDWIESPPQPPA